MFANIASSLKSRLKNAGRKGNTSTSYMPNSMAIVDITHDNITKALIPDSEKSTSLFETFCLPSHPSFPVSVYRQANISGALKITGSSKEGPKKTHVSH